MTLQLRLTSVKDLWGGASKPSFVYVEGGQSGCLILELAKLPQTIKCSIKDHLEFIICGSKSRLEPQDGDVISKQDFWAEAFIDQNRYKWENQDQWYPCKKFLYLTDVMEYYNSKHNKEGELHFEVKYNRALLYQGEIQGFDAIRRKLLPFYKGNVPTANFYNFLDFIYYGNDRHFNFIQHVYQDE